MEKKDIFSSFVTFNKEDYDKVITDDWETISEKMLILKMKKKLIQNGAIKILKLQKNMSIQNLLKMKQNKIIRL